MLKTIVRGNSAVAALLLIATNVSAQEAPRPIIPGNDQQSRQQEEARERERAVSTPGVRSAATASADFPTLPSEARGCQNFRVRSGLSITRLAGQNALRRGWQTDSWLPSNHARRVPSQP